jgi:hypothetical protein
VRYEFTQGPAWPFVVPDGLDRFAIIRERMKKFAPSMGISFFDIDIEDHGSRVGLSRGVELHRFASDK